MLLGGGADSALHVANRVKVFMKELKTTIPTSGRKFIPFSGAGDKAYIKPFCHWRNLSLKNVKPVWLISALHAIYDTAE